MLLITYYLKLCRWLVYDSLPLLLKLERFHVMRYLKGHLKDVFKSIPVVL